MPYLVTTAIDPQYDRRNRLTVAFRIVLAIPHLIAVGGVGLGVAAGNGHGGAAPLTAETGLLGGVAWLLAIVSWVTIVFAGEYFIPIRRFTRFYLRWRVRALAYLMLLADEYPPFGDGPYRASLTAADSAAPRHRVSVGFRLILVLPHAFALIFVLAAWWVTTVVSWVAILISGSYPRSLYDFGAGALRWLIRVEAYMLLLVDDYPPFSLSD